jgi:hypothetical protein
MVTIREKSTSYELNVFLTKLITPLAPGKGLEPLRAKGPLAYLSSYSKPLFVSRSRGQRVNHSATPALSA